MIDQAVWDVLISMLIIYSAGGGREWGNGVGEAAEAYESLKQHCPVHAGFSGAFSFLLPRRG